MPMVQRNVPTNMQVGSMRGIKSANYGEEGVSVSLQVKIDNGPKIHLLVMQVESGSKILVLFHGASSIHGARRGG